MQRISHRSLSLSLFVSMALLGAVSCKTSTFTSQPATRGLSPKATTPVTPNTKPIVVGHTQPGEVVSPISSGTLEGTDGQLDGIVKAGPSAEPAAPPLVEPAPTPEAKFTEVNETFTQKGVIGSADILIVVDDSDSMEKEQKNLSGKLTSLLSSLKDIDWQIGVVSTTTKTENKVDKCVIDIIKSSESDIEARFVKAVTKGTNGSTNEQGIRQAVNGLKCPEKPWVRPDSTVAVLILSDEDNCSNGRSCKKGAPGIDKQYLIDYVEKDLKRTVGMNAAFYGIFYPPAQVCKSALNKANIYQALVDYRSMGKLNYGNICDESYDETLQRISSNIAKLLMSQFKLKQAPISGSVKIEGRKANGDAIGTSDFDVNQEVITFHPGHEPALDSEIVINYKIAG
jgi:hypothetical protein